MNKTKIQWADYTWNPVVGCSRVSAGCTHCYAERTAARLARMGRPEYKTVADGRGNWTGEIVTLDGRLAEPLAVKKPSAIFVCSMSDLFHEKVSREFHREVLEVIWRAKRHQFLVLTKRPNTMVSLIHCDGWPENAWVGVSAEDQATLDERLDILDQVYSGVKKFLSAEPLLGPMRLDASRVDCVIVGGESGPNARPMHPEWIRGIRQDCKKSGTPFFLKQWGAWSPLEPYSLGGQVRPNQIVVNGDSTHIRPHVMRRTRTGEPAMLNGKVWDPAGLPWMRALGR